MFQNLREEAESTDSDSLREHLVKVIKQMLLNNDHNSYQLFEYYSQKIKSKQSTQLAFRSEEYEMMKQYIKKAKNLLDRTNVGSEEQPAQPGPTGYVPNLLQQNRWLQRCGVGLGDELIYTIFKSMQKFSIAKQIKQLKFWGKIMGYQADYYIAESAAEEGEEEVAADVQSKGNGVNKNSYWVITDLLNGEWKELPTITPSQIMISRRIKYLFSGNLQKQIFTNPYFHGKESHLLKCQIVRINHACTIIPRTMYIVNPDDKKQIDLHDEEWKFPDFAFLGELGNWVHYPQNILKNGRMTILKPQIPQDVEVDQQKLMKELQQKDPLEQRLKPISNDIVRQNKQGWTIKKYGDCSEYLGMSKNGNQFVNYGFICLGSLVWRGWYTVYHNKAWMSIYVGYGFKSTDGWYFPREPEAILEETKERQEITEPNFPPEVPKQQVEVEQEQEQVPQEGEQEAEQN